MNEFEVKGRAARAVRDSLVIVMGRAKSEESEVKVLKAEWRSLFAGWFVSCWSED